MICTFSSELSKILSLMTCSQNYLVVAMIAYGGRWDIRHALEVLPGLSNVALRQCIVGPGSGVTQNKTKIFFLVKYF